MKKTTIILFLLVHCSVNIYAQWEAIEVDVFHNWGPTTRVDAHSDDGSFFFYGGATPMDTNGQPIMNGFLFSTYNQGIVKDRVLVNNPIHNIVEFQGDTILAGAFHTVYHIDSFPAIQASIQRVLVLNNGTMQQLGGFNASCRVKRIGDELYFFGHFTIALGDSCNVIKWDGESWSIIGPPIDASFSAISDVANYNDELYIAGNIIMNNGFRDILVLRDGEWQEVGVTIPAGIASFNKLVVYNGELYAAGMIRKIDGFAGNMIQRWTGEVWQEVGNSLYSTGPGSFSQAQDMKVHGDYLYVSGHIYTAGGIDAPGIARWDGSQWCGLYTQGMVGMINSFALTDGELYVRQMFDGIPAGNPAFIHRYIMGDEVFPCSEVFTGVDDESNVVFSLRPNPTSHFLTLTSPSLLPGTQITVYNLAGQQVYGQELSQTTSELVLDVRQFGPAGMYLLHVQPPGMAAVVKKVVVQE
jgi:hypothetical protein